MPDPKRARLPMTLAAAGDSHIGRRPHNEDTILVRPDLKLCIVADGAGGHNAGNVASTLATTTVAHFLEQRLGEIEGQPPLDRLGLSHAARRLAMAVQTANREILSISKRSERHRGMGTTIVAGLFRLEENVLHLAYVGDSRCYRLRGGRLERLSHDHSFVNDVLEMRPEIDDDRVLALPQNVVTRALGMSSRLRVSMRSFEIDHGDRYLFCSDGLSDVASERQLAEALSLPLGCDEVTRLLIQLSLEGSAPDNVAVIVADCTPSASYGAIARPARPTPTPAPPEERQRESLPEIVMMPEPPPEAPEEDAAVVVPSEAATAQVVEALAGFIKPSGMSLPRRTKSDWAADLDAKSGETGRPPPPELELPLPRPLPPPPPRAMSTTRDFTNESAICPLCGSVVAAEARTCKNCGVALPR